MDPNEALKQLRNAILGMRNAEANNDLERQAELGQEIADRAETLDAWIVNGGFLPDGWQQDTEGCSCGMADKGAPGHDHEIVGTDENDEDVYADDLLDQRCPSCAERDGHGPQDNYRCNACGEYSDLSDDNTQDNLTTHQVTLERTTIGVFVDNMDEQLQKAYGDDGMLNAAAVGHNELIQVDVITKRLADGHTETFTADQCKEWWA